MVVCVCVVPDAARSPCAVYDATVVVPTMLPHRSIWYPVTATLSVDAVHESTVWVSVVPEAERFPGIDGLVTSAPTGAAGVVTDRASDGRPTFPAASYALMVRA